jgi:hypothetical protein
MNRVINIWADVICPFCYLGSVSAEQAARELRADLRWLPFEIHPDTPPEGAPKPFSPEEWPQVRARLERLAQEIGLPIDAPRHNVNSRLRVRLLSSCAPKRAMAKPGLFATTFRARFSPNTPISRTARSSSQSLNASACLLQTWKPPGTSAGFLRRSTPSSKTGTRSASGASLPWGGRIGGQSSIDAANRARASTSQLGAGTVTRVIAAIMPLYHYVAKKPQWEGCRGGNGAGACNDESPARNG